MPSKSKSFEYDVALSFAGEDRPIAEQFAKLFKAEGFEVFYDNWKRAELLGEDLYQHLDDVYTNKARFCVMFLSKHYAAKAWTNHEMKAAQARLFKANEAYILPMRLDETEIPGIRPTMGYLDLRKEKIEDAAAVVIEKLRATKSPAAKTEPKPKAPEDKAGGTVAKKSAPKPMLLSSPPVKKHFTEHDRDTFLEKAFGSIARLFKASLVDLRDKANGVIGEFRKLNNNHFTAIIYRDGKSASKCGIRIGGGFGWGSKQIAYSDQPESTNSMNDWLTVSDDGQTLFLKANGHFAVMGGAKAKDQLTPKDAAELFWARLIAPLQR